MFTGIISDTAKLVDIQKGKHTNLDLQASLGKYNLGIGDSVAVNGICLTLVQQAGDRFRFNLSEQTWKLSNFSDLGPGALLNLEIPLKMSDFIGGHLVSGHIDGTVRVKSKRRKSDSTEFLFTFSRSEWRQFIIPKGSIALNGVSLTVASVHGTTFRVAVIPHSLDSTNLKFLKSGDRVNVEFDLIGKYIYNQRSLYGKVK